MHSINRDIEEFQKQLTMGSIQKAYRALLSYMMGLRTHFKDNLAGVTVSGLYHGYMDMTYFALFPSSLKQHNLKIAIVFNYDEFQFEAWLSGRNRQAQQHYWALCKEGQWTNYRVVTPGKGVNSILKCDLATDFNLDEPDALTASIEVTTVAFINDIEQFLIDGHISTSI